MADATAEILALDRAFEDAIIAVDAATLDRLALEDLAYTHAGGWVEGKVGFIDHITSGALRFESIDYEDTRVVVHGDTAVLTCALHLDTRDRSDQAGELHFRMTHVWHRSPTGWKLLASQSTHIPPPGDRTPT